MKLFTLLFLNTLLLLGCQDKLDRKIILFDKYDFNSGEHKLIFYGQEGRIIKNYPNFYIDDIKTLNAIKKEWCFTKKSDIMSCGYSYNMQLIKNDSVLIEKSINVECEYMSGWLYFPKEFLVKHKSSFKKFNL